MSGSTQPPPEGGGSPYLQPPAGARTVAGPSGARTPSGRWMPAAAQLRSCDDLHVEAPPLSRYEQYGGTCGGRVELGSVHACTELD